MQIIGIVFICVFGHFCSYFALSKNLNQKRLLAKCLGIASAIIAITAFSGSIELGFLFLLLFCMYFSRALNQSDRVIVFLGLLFMMPDENAIYLRMGFDFGTLTHTKVLVLGLLLAPLVKLKKVIPNDRLNGIDYSAISFILWTMLGSFELGDVTTIVRINFWTFIKLLVPYLVIRFCLADYRKAFVLICFGLFAQAFISIAEGVLSWKVYTSLKFLSGYAEGIEGMYKFRHGFLRAEASYGNPLILSLFSNFAVLGALLMYRIPSTNGNENSQRSRIIRLGVVLSCCASVFFSGSRAGMAGAAVSILLLAVINWASYRRIDPKVYLKFISVFLLCLVWIFGSDYIKQEFDYRYRIITTSLEILSSYLSEGKLGLFLKGTLYIDLDPRLEPLRQGEGIIDLVNTYVVIALQNGVVGLSIFLMTIGTSISKLYAAIRLESDDIHLLGKFILCCILILTFNIATTSPIGLLYDYIWILFPISANVVAARNYKIKIDDL